MGIARLIPNYTYQDYLHWEGKWELIEGIPFAKSPSPSVNHQRIASLLNVELGISLRNTNCDCLVYQPLDVKISDNTVLQPDLLIICNKIEGSYIDQPFPHGDRDTISVH